MTCQHCSLPENEGCAYPYYGVAPHDTNPNSFRSELNPSESWPSNFKPDLESAIAEVVSNGTYTHCPECGESQFLEYRKTGEKT